MPFEDHTKMVMKYIEDGIDPLSYRYHNNKYKSTVIEENDQLKDVLTMCFKPNHEERPTAE